jgi:hypothetical protein
MPILRERRRRSGLRPSQFLADMLETRKACLAFRRAKSGGEAGIRTLGRAFRPYNGLANRRLQPLGHLTATRTLSIREALSCANPAVPKTVPEIVPVGPTAVLNLLPIDPAD